MHDVVLVREVGEVRHRLADGDRALAVEDHAHRALVGVLGEQHDGLPEVGVGDRRRGDEQLSAQRLHARIVPQRGPAPRGHRQCKARCLRTLVISDLHLGSLLARDVLRRPAALDALTRQAARADRLVLLGDTLELLDERPAAALAVAGEVMPVLAGALRPGASAVVVAGNHDHALVRPWLRERLQRGQGDRTGTARSARAPARSWRSCAGCSRRRRSRSAIRASGSRRASTRPTATTSTGTC